MYIRILRAAYEGLDFVDLKGERLDEIKFKVLLTCLQNMETIIFLLYLINYSVIFDE